MRDFDDMDVDEDPREWLKVLSIPEIEDTISLTHQENHLVEKAWEDLTHVAIDSILTSAGMWDQLGGFNNDLSSWVEALYFADVGLVDSYLPEKINHDRILKRGRGLEPRTHREYFQYGGIQFPQDLRLVEGDWFFPFSKSYYRLRILDIEFTVAAYWLPPLLHASPILQRIILRNGNDINSSFRTFDFPTDELEKYFLVNKKVRLLLPFVSLVDRPHWINRMWFSFKNDRIRFISSDLFQSGADLDGWRYHPKYDPFDRGLGMGSPVDEYPFSFHMVRSLECEQLPLRTYSLDEFSLGAKELLPDPDTKEQFVRFVLTGAYLFPNGFDNHQAILDPIQNALQEDHRTIITRDYDSVLGISPELAPNIGISVYLVAKFEDTLSKNVYIDHPVNKNGEVVLVSLHQIPNLSFGKFGDRSHIRVSFPSLYSEDRSKEHRGSRLTRQEQILFYEKGLKPTIDELMPEMSSEWPVTYQDELTRAMRRSGAHSFQTKMLPSSILPNFGTVLRGYLAENEVDWAEDLVFIHQIRGTKATSGHRMNPYSAATALAKFMRENSIDMSSIQHGDWFIDVGLEFSSVEKECLLWRTDSHSHVVKHVAGISEEDAVRITSIGSTKYSRDLASHLLDVSGCRITHGARGEGENQIRYIQLYSTDKSLTYNPDGYYYGNAMSCSDILGKQQPPSFITNHFNLYSNAARSRNSNSNARVEIRVPFNNALNVLLTFPDQLIQNSMVSFSNVSWWGLRSYRIAAAGLIMQDHARAPREHRITDESLLLLVGLCWLVNSLTSRHEDNYAGRDLMRSILPHVDRAAANEDHLAYRTRLPGDNDDDEASVTVPHNPHGMIFFRRFYLPPRSPVPRFRAGRMISEKSFEKFFGKSLLQIKESILPVGIVGREAIPVTRVVTNKTRNTPLWFSSEPVTKLFDLSEEYSLPGRVRDDCSDMGDGDERNESSSDIDERLTILWNQFIVDVVAKSPNPQGRENPSYCRLTSLEKRSVTEEVFKTRNLARFFNECYYKLGDEEEFKRIFKHLWPEPGHVAINLQNYPSTRYYKAWKALIAELHDDIPTVTAMRKQIKKRFDSLEWMPHAAADKMWISGARNVKGFTRLPENSGDKPAPRVVTWNAPTWIVEDSL